MSAMQEGRRPWLIAGGLALVTGIWIASGLLAPAEVETPEDEGGGAESVTEVRVESRAAEEVVRNVEVFGRTAPSRSLTLKAETAGRVTKIHVPRGARASRGDALIGLDIRDREARLETARALVRQRELEYKAQTSLEPQGYISQANLAEARANLEAAKGELRRAELDLEYRTLDAPFDGAVQDRLVEVGDYVQPGDPMIEYVDERSMIVTGEVAEQDVAGLEVGDTGTAILSTGETVEGRIRYVAPVADRQTRTFRIELEIPNPDGTLRGGVTAEVDLDVDTVRAHRISPALLSLDDEGVLGVKVVDDDDRVAFHAVDVVASGPEGAWVTGLPERTRIITVGQGWVRPGQTVRTVSEGEVDAALAREDR